MKLADRTFERRVRVEIKKEASQSPALKTELRKYRRPLRSHLESWGLNWLILISCGLFIGWIILGKQQRVSEEARIAQFTIWMTGLFLVQLNNLSNRVFASPEIDLLVNIPIPGRDLLRVLWKRSLRESWTLFLYPIAGLTALGWGNFTALHGMSVVLWGSVTALCILALAALVVGYTRLHRYFGLLSAASKFAVIAGWIIFSKFPERAFSFIEEYASFLNGVLPFGWTTQCYSLISEQPGLLVIVAVITGTGFYFVFRLGTRAMETRYAALFDELSDDWESIGFELDDENKLHGSVPVAGEVSRELQGGLVNAIRKQDGIRNGYGLLEHLVFKWIGKRGKVTLEFMTADELGWSRKWVLGSSGCLFFIFMSLYMPQLARTIPVDGLIGVLEMVPAFGIVIFALIGLPVIGGYWEGLTQRYNSGNVCPYFCLMPVSLAEIVKTGCLVNFLRIVFFFPCVILADLLVIRRFIGEDSGAGWIAVKFVLLLVVFQPLMLLLQVSEKSTDSRTRGARGCLYSIVLLGSILSILGIVIWYFVDTRINIVALGILIIISGALTVLYLRLFNRNRFDVLKPFSG